MTRNFNCIRDTLPPAGFSHPQHRFPAEESYLHMLKHLRDSINVDHSTPECGAKTSVNALNRQTILQLCRILADVFATFCANEEPPTTAFLVPLLRLLVPWRLVSEEERSPEALALVLSNASNQLPIHSKQPLRETSDRYRSQILDKEYIISKDKENIPVPGPSNATHQIPSWRLIHNHNLKNRPPQGWRRCEACGPRQPLGTIYLSPHTNIIRHHSECELVEQSNLPELASPRPERRKTRRPLQTLLGDARLNLPPVASPVCVPMKATKTPKRQQKSRR